MHCQPPPGWEGGASGTRRSAVRCPLPPGLGLVSRVSSKQGRQGGAGSGRCTCTGGEGRCAKRGNRWGGARTGGEPEGACPPPPAGPQPASHSPVRPASIRARTRSEMGSSTAGIRGPLGQRVHGLPLPPCVTTGQSAWLARKARLGHNSRPAAMAAASDEARCSQTCSEETRVDSCWAGSAKTATAAARRAISCGSAL